MYVNTSEKVIDEDKVRNILVRETEGVRDGEKTRTLQHREASIIALTCMVSFHVPTIV